MGRLFVAEADGTLAAEIGGLEHERRFAVDNAGLELRVNPTTQIILGIDPGLARLGWGLVQQVGLRCDYVASGVIETKPTERRPDERRIMRHILVPRAERLLAVRWALVTAVHAALPRSWPDVIVIEALFWGQNVTSALDLARVAGTVEVWAAEMEIPVVEYGVKDVRKVVAQAGDSDDRLVAAAVARHLHLLEPIKADHENDALAMALRHALGGK